MQTLKSVFGVARLLMPIGYCGYLIYYFIDLSGSVKDAWDTGLGPTVLGLGVVSLLFGIAPLFKLIRMLSGPRWPRSGGRPDAPAGHGDDDDNNKRAAAADAAIARYMARKAVEDANASAPTPQRSGPAARPSFGRKNG